MAQNTGWASMPAELLLEVLSNLDPLSRINAAIAHPAVFLRPGFNVFVQDAEDQIRRRRGNTTSDELFPRPLLYTAIEADVGVEEIAHILGAYVSIYPASINGLWCDSPTFVPPPLSWAAWLGKPQVVSLLLDEGANPSRLCNPDHFTQWRIMFKSCALQYYNHDQCQFVRDIRPVQTDCASALTAATFKGLQLEIGSVEHQAVEECAAILYRRGPGIPFADLDALQRQIVFPIQSGFGGLVRTILDTFVAFHQENPGFSTTVLREILRLACMHQKAEDRTIIEYLLGIGAPLVDQNTGHGLPNFAQTDVARLITANGYKATPVWLLNRYADQGVLFNYSQLPKLVQCEYMLPYVQALYRVMSQENQTYRGRPVLSRFLHDALLTEAIDTSQTPAIRWLLEQKVGSSEHVHHAIDIRDKTALLLLLEAGHGVSGMVDQDDAGRTPLEHALVVENWDAAGVLVLRGADASLVSLATKRFVGQEFIRHFPELASRRPPTGLDDDLWRLLSYLSHHMQ
ncbi:hypothetical protein F5Y10DRAFT_263630 [Nemania abortiva]|nr:hypothetical protein F5Y10DRAFT_263630 [Nemania abortiva]